MVPAPHIEFFLEKITYLTLFHAKVAAFLLYYVGYDITSHGLTLSLPAGSVDVHPGCSGQPLMFLLLRIGLIFCLAIPVRWMVRLTLFLGAIAMGAVTGIIRIATLAAAVQNPHWFEGIHGWYGGSFFTALGILLFAPFLIPFEKPLADLLRICQVNWDSAGAGGSRQYLRFSIAGLLGFACAFYLVNRMGDRDGDGRPELIGWKALEFAPPGSRAIQVPDKLSANRFGLVKSARLWRSTTAGKSWTVLVCPISNGLVGPHDLLLSGLWDKFLLQQFPNVFPLPSDIVWKKMNVSANAKGGIIGIAKTSRGAVAVVGVNPEGGAFFDSDDYSAAQSAALSRWQTWKRWFIAGNPLKNSRYQLVIIALDCDPALTK